MKPLGNDESKLPGMKQNYVYRNGGDNTFMPDTDDIQLPGKVGLKAIGGIVNHLGGLTAIGCSTVNSYRRLWDTGFWAPVFADWGFQNRTTGLARLGAWPLRISRRRCHGEPTPYGGRAHQGNGRRAQTQSRSGTSPRSATSIRPWKRASRCKKLPMTLGDALDALEKDDVIKLGAARRDVPPVRRV